MNQNKNMFNPLGVCNMDWKSSCLVLICRQHTWDIAAGTAWDIVMAYVNIYRRIIIYPRHSPSAWPRSWAKFNFASEPVVVGGCRRWKILCEHHLRMQRTTVGRFDPYLQVKWWKLQAPIWFSFCTNLSMLAIHRRCAGDPLEQITECCQLQHGLCSKSDNAVKVLQKLQDERV